MDWEGPRKISSLLRRPSHAMGAFRKAAVLLAGAARIPRITFPVRMINGTRVSDLPAAEAKAFAQKARALVSVQGLLGDEWPRVGGP